jgi:hypothetical protein
LLVNLVLIFEDSNHAILHPHQLGTFAITLSIGLTRWSGDNRQEQGPGES